MLALSVNHLSVQYHQQKVLDNINFQVPKGSITGIIGPNGAGKSTLMKAILGLVPTINGSIEVLEQPFRRQKDLIGYVPQRSEVDWDFPINGLDVVLMGRYKNFKRFQRISKKEKNLAMDYLREIGMEQYAQRQISQLSGGQQQRIFLARALAQNTPIYFMDEPFAGVDAATERMMIQLMKQWKEEGKTVLIVHHDLQTVQEYFDHILLLNKKIIDCGKTSDIFHSENIERTYGGSLKFPSYVVGNSL